MKQFYLMTASVALLAACGGNTADQTATSDTTDDTADAPADPMAAPVDTAASDAAPTDAAGYAAKAGAGDKWEIESSTALLAKSTNADVKKFAQMMVDHHSKSTEKVKAAAKTANITLAPPGLDAMQQQMLDDIKNADAAGIDAVYIKHQKTAHDAALKLNQGYAANGDNAEFKKAAGEIVPVVQSHIAELGKMKMS